MKQPRVTRTLAAETPPRHNDSLRSGTNLESLRFQISSPIAATDPEPPRSAPLAWSLGGGALIALVFYLLQALGMQSWTMPFSFLADNWFFVSPLILGFAIQTGLFRAIHLRRHPGGGAVMATSGGMSAGAMFACCLHNLVFLFPLLGATGIAAFFSTYQTEVFLASIVFVLIGIAAMLRTLRSASKSGCHTAERNPRHP